MFEYQTSSSITLKDIVDKPTCPGVRLAPVSPILNVFTGSFIDLVSKCFESSLRVNIICIRTHSLYFQREKLLQSQFKVISELADQVFFVIDIF